MMTADVVSMFTNIDVENAIRKIGDHIKRDPLRKDIIRGLQIVMTNNYFTFNGDLFLQVKGTAMGTPVAPVFASLFLGIAEIDVVPSGVFYKRFIDDIFVITSQHQGDIFASLTSATGLRFTTTSPTTSGVKFLDLMLSFNSKGEVTTRTNIKDLNLHLYIPGTSAHPPGMLKGLVFGRLLKYSKQNTDHSDFKFFTVSLFQNLMRRGYRHHQLKDVFNKALEAIRKTSTTPKEQDDTPKVFIKVPYHPNGPSRQDLRSIFAANEIQRVTGNKVIVCFTRPKNLKEML